MLCNTTSVDPKKKKGDKQQHLENNYCGWNITPHPPEWSEMELVVL